MFELFFEASLFGIENKRREKYIEQGFLEQQCAQLPYLWSDNMFSLIG